MRDYVPGSAAEVLPYRTLRAVAVACAMRTKEKGAKECFRQARDIAHCRSARSLELRAIASRVRLWQHQGKTKQAHKLLSEIYNWFIEGFDTKDLQEAKALLDDLGKRRNGEKDKG